MSNEDEHNQSFKCFTNNVEMTKLSYVYRLPQFTKSLFTSYKALDYALRKIFLSKILWLLMREQNICVTNYLYRIHPTGLWARINLALCSVLVSRWAGP